MTRTHISHLLRSLLICRGVVCWGNHIVGLHMRDPMYNELGDGKNIKMLLNCDVICFLYDLICFHMLLFAFYVVLFAFMCSDLLLMCSYLRFMCLYLIYLCLPVLKNLIFTRIYVVFAFKSFM